ncbi:peptidylprolyl isomerase [Planctomicrobium sp. SH664]|uniref:peptidylprolyl isomerase n=1 Tax=Planctomicrobium sp. SH664 TaxID=3448125 RepID=UPI003F5B1C75
MLLTTSQGNVELELFENEAPNTVANFINLVDKGFYNGLRFHRVIPDFMIQGGCPNSRNENSPLAGTGGPGYHIKCESSAPNARRHFSGSLSMAHAGKDTGGSQFFITHLPTPHLDRPNPNAHTVFGRVVSGLDVVRKMQPNDSIISAKVERKRAHEYTPVTIPDPDQPGVAPVGK